VSGEGLVAFGVEDLLPLAEKVLGDVERAGGLGEGVAFVGDQLDGSGLELSGIRASGSCHRGPPESEFTLLSGCPPLVGSFSCGISSPSVSAVWV